MTKDSGRDRRPNLSIGLVIHWLRKDNSHSRDRLGGLAQFVKIVPGKPRDGVEFTACPTRDQVGNFTPEVYALYLLLTDKMPEQVRTTRREMHEEWKAQRPKGAKKKGGAAATTPESDSSTTTSDLTQGTDGTDSSTEPPPGQVRGQMLHGGGLVVDGHVYVRQADPSTTTTPTVTGVPAGPNSQSDMTPGEVAKQSVDTFMALDKLAPDAKATVMQSITSTLDKQHNNN